MPLRLSLLALAVLVLSAHAAWEPDVGLTDASNSSLFSSVAVADSCVHVVWQDARNVQFEVYYKLNPNGNPVGIAEARQAGPRTEPLFSTVVRGDWFLSGPEAVDPVDVSGRRMMRALPGPNHLTSLRPGVCFVRRAGWRVSRRVVVVD